MLKDHVNSKINISEWKADGKRRLRFLWVLSLAITMCFGTRALAQPLEQLKPEPAAAKPSTTAVATVAEGRYDVDASGTDIKYVLEALARRSGTNIVVSPEVQGEVTVHLKQSTIEEVLNCVAIVQGFGWKKVGDAYLVAPKDKFEEPKKPEPTKPEPVAEVIELKYLVPLDTVPMLIKFFPALKVSVGPASTTPTLETTESSSASTTSNSGGSGEDASTSSSSSASSTVTNKYNSKIVIMGDPTDVAMAKDMLLKLDVPRPQVAIEVAIVQINSSVDKNLGINWSWTNILLNEETPSSGIRFGQINRGAMNFTGELSALVENDAADLLAKPNISVIDGEYADILIGDRILFPKLIGYTNNNMPIFDKEEERVGIYLQIAPKVTAKDELMLTLYPQVSLVTDYLKTQVGDYPQISTREARTTVMVKSGATLAIGGLLREDEIVNGSKIPLLGDLPIIGHLFRHKRITRERNEIVIFLTPMILGREDSLGAESPK